MRGLLKFITCGSVDDGKSTLIGHILYDAKLLYADQEKSLELDSKVGSRAGKIDYSLLLDGLMAEREQGITIDVAYRYFTTDHRSFIVADTPGHEEYTRNMAVGASFAELAVILVDAKQGVLVQTRRHARICSLMGIRQFVFAVNKMDLVGYEEAVFRKIEAQVTDLAGELSLSNVAIIPVSATEGDNVTHKSEHISWYEGEALLPHLEQVDVSEAEEEKGFYMPVQRVCRPNHEFRGFQGQIEAGTLSVGDDITTLPSNGKARIKSIYIDSRREGTATKGQPVTIQLDREVDVSRGCVLSAASGITSAASIEATLLWMDDDRLISGRNFFVKIGTRLIPGVVTEILHTIDVNSGKEKAAGQLDKNEIAVCRMALSEKIAVARFDAHKTLGELILIDRVTNMTSACGVITELCQGEKGLRDWKVNKQARSIMKGQRPVTVEFPLGEHGLTLELVEELEKLLAAEGKHTYVYVPENELYLRETVKHLNEAGIIVLLVLKQELTDVMAFAEEKSYYRGWQEDIGLTAKEIAGFIIRESSVPADVSLYGDYI